MDRRTFIATTAAAGTTVVAGCGGSSDGSGSTDGSSTDSGSVTGEFRLLISDQPADISDFDSLDVTFDRARVFRKQEDDEDGFTVFELDSPTVDLTEVVGDKAIGVLDGKLEVGEYSKIELYVSDVEGVVDGETVPVKVPSNKLQIAKSFEVTADEPVEFVFDINVVKKGNGGYNLLPVISKSGVAGKDVAVEEIEDDENEDDGPATGTPTGTETVTSENESTTNETASDA